MTRRVTSPALEEILYKELPVLDHGFVRVVDYMGDDSAPAQAARVSYGDGTKTVRDDRGLTRYLIRHRHTSPLEMCEVKFHVKLPIFVARQWVRHRTANLNEISGRYSILPEEFYVPDPDKIQKQSKDNKQGRGESFDEATANHIRSNMETMARDEFKHYNWMVAEDVARELARVNLPLSTYTEWYWKIDLHNLLHFLSLRMDAHAQYEIRAYGDVIGNIVEQWVPHVWEAFVDYRLKATGLSRMETELVRELLEGQERKALGKRLKEKGCTTREIREFLDRMGL